VGHINTVLGPISPSELGPTSSHEHVFWGPPGWEFDPEWWFHTPKVFEKCLNDLKEYRALGGKTFVDCTGIGLGRDLHLYRMLSKHSGVNIITATGFWAETGIYNHFRDKDAHDIDFLQELFERELTQGIGNTDVRAGYIKVGNSIFSVTKFEEHLHRAAARAAKKRGCAVMTHGGQWQPWELIRIFKEEKLDLSRVIFSHCDNLDSWDYDRNLRLARLGAWVAYDSWGYIEPWYWGHYGRSDEMGADITKALIDDGYGNRLLLASGANLFSFGWQRSSPYVGKNTVCTHMRNTPGQLRRVGIKEDMFWKLMIDNPKEVFMTD